METGRNAAKEPGEEWGGGVVDGETLVWARYDSRPLLKAKEPSGRAESERRRRKWLAGESKAADERLALDSLSLFPRGGQKIPVGVGLSASDGRSAA
jgi:hypothetical protein